MYLTIKQQVKHLSKEEYRTIRELCHVAKNLTNEAIYNVRQYYFTEGEFLKYEKNYTPSCHTIFLKMDMQHLL